jgi:rhamnosyltransferase
VSATNGVLGVVVTYHPDAELPQHLATLRSQVDALVVVDNGSDNRAAVEQAALAAGCRFIGNGANLGIAAALNQGLAIALDEGYAWLATFDQDSHCPEGAIASLLALQQRHPRGAQVALVATAHRDRALQRDYHHWIDVIEETADWRILRAAITSGSLVRVDVLRTLGGFEDQLFIDSVDHELCLRLRRQGWLILEARDVVMTHSIGDASVERLLGLPVVCTHHSAARRYYQVRNLLEISRRYFFFDPAWTLKSLLQLVSGGVAVLLFEPQKGRKLAAMARGGLHFLRRRFGALS